MADISSLVKALKDKAVAQYEKGAPYRQALASALQGNTQGVNQALSQSDLTPMDFALMMGVNPIAGNIPNKQLFFHVTDASNVPSILKEGIQPNKVEGATYGALGQKLSDKGKVYAFDNLNDAIRWQKSKDWANENPQQGLQIIPFFDNPAHYERDVHPELFDYVGPLKKKGSISPEQIATTQFTKPIDKLEQGQKVGEYSLDELAQYGVIPNLNEARMLYKGYGTKADTKNMITPESLGLIFK